MGYRSLAECVRDLERTRQLVVIDQEVDPYLEVAAIQRRVYQAGGPALLFRRVKGTAFPLAGQPVRHARPGEVPVSRHARVGPPAGRAEGRSGRARQEPVAIPRHTAHALAAAAPARAVRADPGPPDRDRPAAADPVLADGRRAVHHLAPGLHRGPRPAGPGAVEPGDVPGPARRQPVRAEPRGRAALPDPPRHRRAPRGGDPPGRAAAGQRLRRRPARLDGRRGHAAARGPARAGVRRRTGRPSRRDGRARRRPPHAGRGRLRHLRLDRSRIERKPEGPFGDHLGYYSLTHDFPGAARRTRLSPRRCHLAVHVGRTAAAGRHDVRRT